MMHKAGVGRVSFIKILNSKSMCIYICIYINRYMCRCMCIYLYIRFQNFLPGNWLMYVNICFFRFLVV